MQQGHGRLPGSSGAGVLGAMPGLTLEHHRCLGAQMGDSCAGSRLRAKHDAFRLVSHLQASASSDLKCKIHLAPGSQDRSGRVGM